MAKFELNIYGENDEILKTHATDHIRYGVLMQALELEEKSKGKSMAEQIKAANTIVKRVFHGLTDDELMLADMGDVLNVYAQVTRQAENINGGSNDPEKN